MLASWGKIPFTLFIVVKSSQLIWAVPWNAGMRMGLFFPREKQEILFVQSKIKFKPSRYLPSLINLSVSVCRPFPSMPVRFWNDQNGALYHAAYFEKFEGVWAHGDFFMIDPSTKGMVMLGR